MKHVFIIFRDILLIFIFTVALIHILSLKKQKNLDFLAFSGLLTPTALQKADPSKLKNRYHGKEYFHRKFLWTDSNKQIRNTTLNIERSLLKKEIKKFGLMRGMTDSLFLKGRGFKIIRRRNEIINGQVVEKVKFIVDYKKIFDRNIPYFNKLTEQLIDSLPDKNFKPVYSFLKFVQYITYQKSPTHYSGKFINKFYIPLVCLYEQSGDCDSKSLLLSQFLATYPDSKEKMGMLLIYGQGIAHAVLAVKKKPLMGMMPLLVKGDGYYIPLETTHIRWSPGFISYRVGKAIKAGFVRFVPLN